MFYSIYWHAILASFHFILYLMIESYVLLVHNVNEYAMFYLYIMLVSYYVLLVHYA